MSLLLVAQRALTVPGWAKDALWRRARAVPSLDLRFADNKSLVDAITGASLVTFTRASDGTFVDSAGARQTAATNVPRFDHNPTTGESLGLLIEEQRTNLLLNSGTLSTQSVTVTAAAHTLSFTGTGTITLTGTSTAGPLVGTGTGEANRVSLTFTPTAGNLTLTVSGTVTNAQLEPGAFRTSYIITAGAQATRTADVASITGANFLSWYNQTQGTTFIDTTSVGSNLGFTFVVSDGTDSNRIGQFKDGSNVANRLVVAGVQNNAGSISYSSAQLRVRSLVSAQAGDTIMCANGTLGTASTQSPLPTVDRITIGAGALSSNFLSGTIRRLCFWSTRLSNSTLQSLTQ